MNLIARSSLAWLGLCALAFANGAVRELIFKQSLNIQEPLAHQFSCLTAILVWTIFTLSIWKPLQITTFRLATYVGGSWLVATFIFETFVLNHNLNWGEVLLTYNVFQGEYWGIALLWIGLLPPAIFFFKKTSTK